MNMMIQTRTGNPIVDAVATLNITGNVIPEAWYHTIVNEKGKVNCLAIHILADIVYWYRPTENRDETTLSVTYTKKFHDEDYLQRSYEQLMDKFNISRKQAYDAIVMLESLGVIRRHLRNLHTNCGTISNVMFIELVPDVLKTLTFPDAEGLYKNVDTSIQKDKEVSMKTATPTSTKGKTYTETSTQINTNISTSSLVDENPSVVDEAKKIFSGLGLSDKDITSIVSASDNNLERCRTAKEVLLQQSMKIHNVAGWLIKAVKENYQPISKTPAIKKNSFHNFHQREYDMGELERLLLTTSLA